MKWNTETERDLFLALLIVKVGKSAITKSEWNSVHLVMRQLGHTDAAPTGPQQQWEKKVWPQLKSEHGQLLTTNGASATNASVTNTTSAPNATALSDSTVSPHAVEGKKRVRITKRKKENEEEDDDEDSDDVPSVKKTKIMTKK
ncbi:hypothetical protein F5Y16DRAFT_393938 [Xylariaceae sp. FL0255]|nr:hypothetical protein F5Y16DRAFT_393938 [Xylariaceae sp. FL0255]